MAIAPRFDRADAFSGGLAVVVSEGKYGYIDTSGNTVIEPRYDWSGRFSEGLALTLEGTTYGYVDRSGELVITLPPPAGLPQSTGEGAGDGLDGLNGLDIEQWQSLLSYCAFSDGLALLEKDGRFGYIDTSGKTAIEPSFDSAKSFSEGLAAVRSGRRWGFVDTSGEMVIEPGLDQVESFSEGLAPYKNRGVWGYINTSGSISINAQYDYAAGFSARPGVRRGRQRPGIHRQAGRLRLEALGARHRPGHHPPLQGAPDHHRRGAGLLHTRPGRGDGQLLPHAASCSSGGRASRPSTCSSSATTPPSACARSRKAPSSWTSTWRSC